MNYVLEEILLSHLQLEHDGTKLHVQIIGSLQFSLIMLPDV